MSLTQTKNTRLALIADPVHEHYKLLREILARNFNIESRWVQSFEELSQLEAKQSRLEYILISESLPLSPSHLKSLPRRYFMKLLPKWKRQLLFITSQGQNPDLIGLPHKPKLLLLRKGVSPATASASERENIEAVFAQLNQERRSFASTAFSDQRQTMAANLQAQSARGSLSQSTDSQSLLAEIKRINQSIPDDWDQIERIKREKLERWKLLHPARERP